VRFLVSYSDIEIATFVFCLARPSINSRRDVLRRSNSDSLASLFSAKDGRGGGDRKQRRQGFRGLTRNAKEHQVIEKERRGTQRNSYCSLNAPSFFSFAQFPLSPGFDHCREVQSRLRAQISRRGWRADIRFCTESLAEIRSRSARVSSCGAERDNRKLGLSEEPGFRALERHGGTAALVSKCAMSSRLVQI
jgi:hypothetical protein